MIVLDASALVELLLATPRGVAVAQRIARKHETVHVPHLVDLEVASALRSLENHPQVSATEAVRAIGDLLAMPMRRYAHDPLLARVWQLRGNLTTYDAVYIALAEYLSAPLITCDAKLAAAPGHRATVDHVA